MENKRLKERCNHFHEWGCGCLERESNAKKQLAKAIEGEFKAKEKLGKEKAAHFKTREQLTKAAVASTASTDVSCMHL